MQITVLVAMSVLLLTVPWMKDHPVTLLVPLALCVVPATASVLRPLLAEVFMSLLGAAKWFMRHRHDDGEHGANASRTRPAQQQQEWHPPGHAAQQRYQQQQYHQQQIHQQQQQQQQQGYVQGPPRHAPAYSPGGQRSQPMNNRTYAPSNGPAAAYHHQAPDHHSNVAHSRHAAPSSELTTPDLEFDEEPRWQTASASSKHGVPRGTLLSNP